MSVVTADLKTKSPGMIINVIIDESGSMYGQWAQTINSFNKYVEEQKKQKIAQRPNNVFLSLTKFNSDAEVVYAAQDIHSVPELDETVYYPRGRTALYDAVGKTVLAVEKAIEEWERKPAVLNVIITDGYENSSKEFTNTEQMKELIERKENDGWTFVYLGSTMDTNEISREMGISSGNTLQYAEGRLTCAMRSLATGTRAYVDSINSDEQTCANMDFFREVNYRNDD